MSSGEKHTSFSDLVDSVASFGKGMDLSSLKDPRSSCNCSFCSKAQFDKVVNDVDKSKKDVKQVDLVCKPQNDHTSGIAVSVECCVCSHFGTNSSRMSEFRCKYCSIKKPYKSSSIHCEPGLYGRHSNDLFDGWPLLADGSPMFYH